MDTVIGTMSRLLHLRGAHENTIADLQPYLDMDPVELFNEAPVVPDRVDVKRTFLDNMLGTSTVRWKSTHTCISPTYQKRHENEYAKNLMAQARWWRPDGRKRKGILVYVHGWLEPGSWAEESTLFRKWAKELDVDLAHVSLPFHGVRKPKSALFSGEFFWTADLVRTVEGVRQAVYDTRTFIAWLRTQGYNEIGVTGISLGGAITMMTACFEPGPDYIVPIIAHLQLQDAVENAPILWRMKKDLENWGIDRQQRHELFEQLGLNHLSPYIPPERQLWVQAREDVYIDAGLAERQWRDWGEPNILWIDGGHMTFPLHIEDITRRIEGFLADLRSR